ncbi:P-II family nitrogen regulator [Bifidobacterium bombi]|uniref:Nitrogen regulatory protein P-II n=1 Tax=Bifidobacterium bombi DSM 19703 TaxID=1341695 RepID=A0A086BPA2_9BIFI|nr:P-II family nitrogen regulator [Bifidobacterium bombi]KFF31766.1 nitrogen regulatory protein P-II [Bifidobacterium bombi DSM 19703]
MKLITAIIRPQQFSDVKEALEREGVRGLTVSDVAGYGCQHGHAEVYRGVRQTSQLVQKIRLDLVVRNTEADAMVDAIVQAAHTGNVGDGKVWVLPIDSVTRVRTGESDAAAL